MRIALNTRFVPGCDVRIGRGMRAIIAGAVVALCTAGSSAHAQAPPPARPATAAKKAILPPLPQLREQYGIRFLQGGRGEEARSAMADAARAFNLHLQFAAGPHRRSVWEVRVLVQDLDGEVVFDLHDAGPWLLVDLPRGQYLVRAEYDGVVRTRAVVLGEHSGVKAVFEWPEADVSG